MSMKRTLLFIIYNYNNGHSYNDSDNCAIDGLLLSHNNNGCNDHYHFINYLMLFNLLLVLIQKCIQLLIQIKIYISM